MSSGRYFALLLATTLFARPAFAQYAEIPRPLPNGSTTSFGFSNPEPILAATQIGRRLFIGGRFTHLGTTTGGAAVVDALGVLRPGAFPVFGGSVAQLVADGVGGWFAAGTFTSVAGHPIAGFARVSPDRTVDERFTIVTNGSIRLMTVAHGRVYLAGDFTTVNGRPRRGLAALNAATGVLSDWGANFDPRGRVLTALTFSSIGVYVSGRGGSFPTPDRLWGFDASGGRVMFERPSAFVSALAASSARVYVGGLGYERPVWALDPFTGEDTSWAPDMQFVAMNRSGGEATSIGAMLLDGGRLYFGGRFLTTTGRRDLTAVNADTGERAPWRPEPRGFPTALTRVGPYIVSVTGGGFFSSPGIDVFEATDGKSHPLNPGVVGSIATAALAPEGVVLGGTFSGSGGLPRSRVASVDLDTFAVEPWTSSLAVSGFMEGVEELATDGTWLVARTGGRFGDLATRFLKIDPASGAVVAEHTLPAGYAAMAVAGGEIFVVVSGNSDGLSLGVITIADWSYRALPATFTNSGPIRGIPSVAVDGDTIYVGGVFSAVNGQSRASLAAFNKTTGALLAWRPVVNASPVIVRAAGQRVWIGGAFSKVNGQRCRGLAELDPVTGAVLPWNPDVLGVVTGDSVDAGVNDLALGPDGHLYVGFGGPFSYFSEPSPTGRPTVSGQATSLSVAFSTPDGRRLPWKPTRGGPLAALRDCFLTAGGCLPRSPGVPTALQVTQTGGSAILSWNLPASAARTGVRLEVSAVEGRPPFFSVDLPPNQTSFTAATPPGSYAVRVRALEGLVASLPTRDVSFSAGPAPGAPLDATAVADGPRVTFRWQPPSTGAPDQYLLEGGTSEGRNDLGTMPIAGTATSTTLDVPLGQIFARLVAVTGGARSGPGQELLVDVRPRGCSIAPASGLSASVAGRVVTLSWTPAPDTTDAPPFIVAGSAPGANHVYLEPPAYATSFSIAAPPGTYYVRLQGGCFSSNTSNEVVVVVP